MSAFALARGFRCSRAPACLNSPRRDGANHGDGDADADADADAVTALVARCRAGTPRAGAAHAIAKSRGRNRPGRAAAAVPRKRRPPARFIARHAGGTTPWRHETHRRGKVTFGRLPA
ncbi:hypothetical protein [Paraburkholderia sp. J41]|uniref:hypothetical protein n=1 Tax=Paraburkholderia sp. J41 TaxID=2805433 RepID=UPI002AC36090|nr:hypothetical protein [Paraburkholderia sp. J41]